MKILTYKGIFPSRCSLEIGNVVKYTYPTPIICYHFFLVGHYLRWCLDFDLKWDMGWMNHTLQYMEKDPLFRSNSQSHSLLTFRHSYFRTDNFVLPLSHDEVKNLK